MNPITAPAIATVLRDRYLQARMNGTNHHTAVAVFAACWDIPEAEISELLEPIQETAIGVDHELF